jgi:outer membrane lipoprotein-sorting protein
MRRISLVVAVMMVVTMLLAACGGKKDAASVVKALDQVVGKMSSYQGTGRMTFHTGQQPQEYQVEVWYQQPSFYRIKLTNEKQDITQIVLRNNDGVFVLTPHLNKSFRFQSNWPDNQGQVYLYQSLAQSIIADNDRQFTTDKGAYVFDVAANYQNSALTRQKIWLDQKSLAPKHVQVSDANSNVMIEVDFTTFEFGAKFDKDSFDMQRNMTSMTLPQTQPAAQQDGQDAAKAGDGGKTAAVGTQGSAAAAQGAAAGTDAKGTAAGTNGGKTSGATGVKGVQGSSGTAQGGAANGTAQQGAAKGAAAQGTAAQAATQGAAQGTASQGAAKGATATQNAAKGTPPANGTAAGAAGGTGTANAGAASADKQAAAGAQPDFGIITPSYTPKGVKQQDETQITLGGEKAILLRYSGTYNYNIVELKPEARETYLVPGDIVDLGYTIAVLSGDEKKTLIWTDDGVEYRLSTADLPTDEMIHVAQSVQGQLGK